MLNVTLEAGPGLDLHPTWYGMVIDEVEDDPGQPELKAGDCIVALADTSMQELDAEACEAAFAEALEDGVEALVESNVQRCGELPVAVGGEGVDWEGLLVDLQTFAADFEVELDVVPGGKGKNELLSMSGPATAITSALDSAMELMQMYFPGS